MQRDEVHVRRLDPLGELECRVACLEACAELGGEPTPGGLPHAPEQALELRRVSEQCSAGALVDDLPDGAAEIDVDDVCASMAQNAGGMRHLDGITAEQLNTHWAHQCAVDGARQPAQARGRAGDAHERPTD